MSRFAAKQVSDIDPLEGTAEYQHGFSFPTSEYAYISKPGLNEGVVREISAIKHEPEWMLKLRLTGLQQFEAKQIPQWGGDLNQIDYNKIHYYLRASDVPTHNWEDVPADIKMTFNRLGIPEAERKYLAGVKMQYDCLTADAMVFTPEGPKPIVKLTPGEYVFSLNEKTNLLEKQKVRALMVKGKRNIFEITTQGGRSIKVTENHPFLHLNYAKESGKNRGRFKKEWKYLSELKTGDLIALTTDLPDFGKSAVLPKVGLPKTKVSAKNQFQKYEIDIAKWYSDLRFPTQSSDDLLWLLGFYLGDGFFGGRNKENKRTRIDFAIPSTQKEFRKEFARVIKALFGYEVLETEDRVILNSILFIQFFEKLNFFGNAKTKRIPDWVFSLPISQRFSLIAGYFDADGGIRANRKNKDLVLTSVSAELLHDVKLLAMTCGLNTSQIWKISSKYSYKTTQTRLVAYRLSISGDLTQFHSRVDHKRDRFVERKFIHRFTSMSGTTFKRHCSKNIGYVKILSIDPAGEEEVFDIEVEGFHNFVANGLIVHNSEVVYGSLKNIWAKDGVIFLSMDEGLEKYPELVKEYFGKLIPSGDNKFSALNTAVWSGGSFVYVPKGVEVKMPLQTYFRINAANAGQFERTLIIVDEGAKVHYVEGCFVKGTSIVTKDGLINIEDVKKEDLVLTHTGKYQKVYHTQVRPYSGNLFTITFDNQNPPLVVTEEHPVLTLKKSDLHKDNRDKSLNWVAVKDLEIGDFACAPKGNSYDYFAITEISKKVVKNLPVYNFSVEEDESYLAGGVAVHNCTAPSFSASSLHSAVVEIFVKKGGRCQYTTVQNWYKNIYNLVTKRARVEEEGEMIWTDFNMGSKLTMKYPGFILAGKGARGETLSMALAGAGQHQDTGSKAIHLAPYTSSTIISKSISKDGGRTSYRGLVHVTPAAHHSQNTVICDALLLDPLSRSDTYPTDRILNPNVQIQHEATVSKIGEEQLFYLMSRGLTEEMARKMIVNGFIDDLVKKLPLEYAVEMNRLIDHEMEGSIG